jgi:parallel beta-helix repeat protein
VTDISTTDAVANGTTTLTSATANFQTTIVGNIIYLQGGTGGIAAVARQVTARASTTSITIDASIAASTGMTMNIGGALASPGRVGAIALVAGQYVYIKAGTYTVTSASTNVAAGCVSAASGVGWEGYQTTRGDLGTRPLLQASGISTFTFFSGSPARCTYRNINVDGASLTSSRGFACRGLVYRCGAMNCTNSGFDDNVTNYVQCFATGCTTAGAAFELGSQQGGWATDCIAYNNSVPGFLIAIANGATRCIADSNTGATTDGFFVDGSDCRLEGCIAYNNGRDGFRLDDAVCILQNCIAEDNAGWSYILTGSTAIHNLMVNCAGFTNGGSGETSIANPAGNRNYDYVTGTFFTDAAGQDFSLNNTFGGGAEARGTGYPGVLDLGGAGYLDRGALQHQDGSGGSPGGSPTSVPTETAFGYIG